MVRSYLKAKGKQRDGSLASYMEAEEEGNRDIDVELLTQKL
jgi:hypothetical protein